MTSASDVPLHEAAGGSDIAHVHLSDHRHAHEVRQAARLKLLHDPGAVVLRPCGD